MPNRDKDMRRYGSYLVAAGFILLFVMPVLFSPAEPVAEETAETRLGDTAASKSDGVVERVIDGDTFDLASGERVRLIGIDAPERGEEHYEASAARLRGLIGGAAVEQREVELRADIADKDEYGRLLRYVYLDDVFINELLVREGYARQFPFGDDRMHQDAFAAAERVARAEHLGIWAK